jgi:hypothetical protein
MKEKDISIQNLHGTLEKEQKFKAKLQVRKNEDSEALAKLQTTR